jgi:hypothetical protein
MIIAVSLIQDTVLIVYKKERKIMQTDKKPSALADTMFDMSKSFNNMSRVGNLYGRLNMIKDMQLYLVKEEIKVKTEIEENDITKQL